MIRNTFFSKPLYRDSPAVGWSTDVGLALVLGIYTLVMAWDSLEAGFGYDDLMNATNAWRATLQTLLLDVLKFYEIGSVYRPLGEAFYRVFFSLFAFDPLPYRIACLAILVANTVLFYFFCRTIELSRTAAFLAALFHGYHYGFWSLYYNTGTCYDLLAFLFYYLAAIAYIRSRTTGLPWWKGAAMVGLLTILGLGSKEIAVTLPAVLIAYDVLWRRPGRPRDFAGLIAVIAIVGLYSLGHFLGEKSLNNISTYDPVLRLDVLGNFLGRTFADVFYEYDRPQWQAALFGCGLALAAAAALRRPQPILGLAIFLVGIVPVAFITPRALHAAYIPLAGLAIVYACAAEAVAGRLGRLTHRTLEYALYGVLVFSVVRTHLWVKRHSAADVEMRRQADEIEAVRTRLRELIPNPARGSRILLLEDPFLPLDGPPIREWASVFLVELMYDGVGVNQRFRMDPPPDEETVAAYDYLLTARGALLEPVRVQ